MNQRAVDLEREIQTLEREMREGEETARQMHANFERIKRKHHAAKSRLEAMRFKDVATIEISDHAILRYLQRRHFIDMNEVATEMRNEMKGVATQRELKDRGFLLRGNTVVTYINPDEEHIESKP